MTTLVKIKAEHLQIIIISKLATTRYNKTAIINELLKHRFGRIKLTLEGTFIYTIFDEHIRRLICLLTYRNDILFEIAYHILLPTLSKM